MIPNIGGVHIDRLIIPMLLLGSGEGFYGRQDPFRFGIKIETKYGGAIDALSWFSDVYLCDIIPTIPYPMDECGNLIDKYIAKFEIFRENGRVRAKLKNIYPSVVAGPEKSRVVGYSSIRNLRKIVEYLCKYGLINVEGEADGLSEGKIMN